MRGGRRGCVLDAVGVGWGFGRGRGCDLAVAPAAGFVGTRAASPTRHGVLRLELEQVPDLERLIVRAGRKLCVRRRHGHGVAALPADADRRRSALPPGGRAGVPTRPRSGRRREASRARLRAWPTGNTSQPPKPNQPHHRHRRPRPPPSLEPQSSPCLRARARSRLCAWHCLMGSRLLRSALRNPRSSQDRMRPPYWCCDAIPRMPESWICNR